MSIYEMYGRQAETMEKLREYFSLTQKILQDLKDGTVLPARLVVTSQGWEIGEEEPAETPKDKA